MPQPRVVNVKVNPNEDYSLGDYSIRLLAEGDSWFAWSYLNLKPSSNLLQQLDFDKSAIVVSFAYSGDTIRRMVDFFSNGHFFLEMKSQRYDAILLSAGGNDVIDALYDFVDDAPQVLKSAGVADPADPASYVDTGNLALLTDYVLKNYRAIFDCRATAPAPNKNTPVLLHTYDYAMPRDVPAEVLGLAHKGPWLYPALMKVGAPVSLHFAINKIVFDAVATALTTLADPANNVYVVDTRGTLIPADSNPAVPSQDWINEIHPSTGGYAELSWKIVEALEAIGIK